MDDRKGAETLSSAVRVVLVLALFACGAASGRAQIFRWIDAEGQPAQGTSVDQAPESARASLVGEVETLEAIDGERLRVRGNLVLRLMGIDAPTPPLSHDLEAARVARGLLAKLAGGRKLRLQFEALLRSPTGELLVWAETEDGVLLNEAMIAAGRARPVSFAGGGRHGDRLAAAWAGARAAGLGLHAAKTESGEKALIRAFQGFSLGLYSKQDDFDYGPFLREQRELGARDLMLITPWFMDQWTSTTIVPKEGRSTSLPQVARVMRQARELELEVTLMPIVLLTGPDSEHWRGNIAPLDRDDWFRSYTEVIAAFADLARDEGAKMLLVGSEFSSLERETESWQGLIEEVRRRYDGLLSYSANWDHVEVIRFWDRLDAIGMTGYHSLTTKDDPTLAELTASWSAHKTKLEALLEPHGLPYYFSELGYASLDGINRNPWDYVSPERTDAQEQADCYEAYLDCWNEAGPGFRGAFFYTWWRNDDESDSRQYTVHGKPAEKLIRARFQASSPSRER